MCQVTHWPPGLTGWWPSRMREAAGSVEKRPLQPSTDSHRRSSPPNKTASCALAIPDNHHIISLALPAMTRPISAVQQLGADLHHSVSVFITLLEKAPDKCYCYLFVACTGYLWDILLLCPQTLNHYGTKSLRTVDRMEGPLSHLGRSIGELTLAMQCGPSYKGIWGMLNSL